MIRVETYVHESQRVAHPPVEFDFENRSEFETFFNRFYPHGYMVAGRCIYGSRGRLDWVITAGQEVSHV